MVTDLDTHLVERALVSLGAELTRREHLFSAAGAKDLDDYLDYGARGVSLAPVPRLLIVIDEFASMARELPDFVSGLVNIAQRGRSLGIHLILATQRPSGVVSAEIRANTNLRVALRVTDAAESTDVIDARDAAGIPTSTPGRAYARLGHSSLIPFQTGRVGGRRATAAVMAPEPFLRALDWGDWGRPAPQPARAQSEQDVATDLSLLVQAIRRANDELGIAAQRHPWLPPLPLHHVLDLSGAGSDVHPLDGSGVDVRNGSGADLHLPEGAGRHGADGQDRVRPPDRAHISAPQEQPIRFAWALQDLPDSQEQRPLVIDLAEFGHLHIAGAPRSGRSQALRTIAAAAAASAPVADLHLYGLDCGNGALLPLIRLPHCGAVVQRTETERATRLLARLHSEVLRRQQILGEGGWANVSEQRRAVSSDERLPHILLLLDAWEGFTSTLAEHDGGVLTERLQSLLREGASAGVHVVISGDHTLLSGRVSALCDEKLVLRLADRSDYALASLNHRSLPDSIPPGRGFRAGRGTETQVALLDPDPSGSAQVAALAALGERLAVAAGEVPRQRRPAPVAVLPAQLTLPQARRLAGAQRERRMWAMVGAGGDDLTALGADLVDQPTFLVAGPGRSGRSTALLVMADSLLHQGIPLVIGAPLMSPLRSLAGHPGVRGVITSDAPDVETLRDLLGDEPGPQSTGGSPDVVLMVDDAEIWREIAARDWLRSFVRAAGRFRRAVVLAGNSAEVAMGFSGWQVDVKKNRRGLLLSPQSPTDGDLVGARLGRSQLAARVSPGSGLLHLGDGQLIAVQVPRAETGDVMTAEATRGTVT